MQTHINITSNSKDAGRADGSSGVMNNVEQQHLLPLKEELQRATNPRIQQHIPGGARRAACITLVLLAAFVTARVLFTALPSVASSPIVASFVSSRQFSRFNRLHDAATSPLHRRATTVSRTAPPSTFDGTAAGFANLCSVHYNDPQPVDRMTWAGTSGRVTRDEIETALGLLSQTVSYTTTDGQGNALAYGNFGQAAYNGASDKRLTMEDCSTSILAIRNDPKTGVVLWTGNRDPVWPPGPFPPHNTTVLQAGGCANGQMVANMVVPALFILKSPCLWNLVPSKVNKWSGPTPFAATDTYKTRALALVKAGDLAYSEYFLPHFFDANKNIIQPNDDRWWLVGDEGHTNAPGKLMAFNRRAMILNGLIRLAAIHETSAAKNAALVAKYDSYIEVNIKAFRGSLTATTSLDGHLAYDWQYSLTLLSGLAKESYSVGISSRRMRRFANTLMYNVYQGNNTFAGYIGGTSSDGEPETQRAWAAWTVLGQWVPNWYKTVANANIARGGSMKRSEFSVPLLWTKNAFVTKDWTGGFATGKGSIAGTA